MLWHKVGAEAVGTFALVFVGCGAIVVDAQNHGVIGHVGIGLAFGLVIMVMIYAVGHISGAHFNPAVTIAFSAMGRFPWRQAPGYVAAQTLAALVAAGLLRGALGDVASLGATQPTGGLMAAVIVEFVLSFFLMFVIFAVATDSRAEGQMAGMAIGGTVALAALFGGPVSGASMNPARSLGPALIAGQLEALWVYLLAPVIGAVAGAWTYRMIRGDDEAAEHASSQG